MFGRLCSLPIETIAKRATVRPGESSVPDKSIAVQIREPRGAEEMESYYDLRWRTLREPWSQERGGERDQHEDEAIHLSAWFEAKLVGVGRAHFVTPDEAQIRYMAVEGAYRRRGIGALILHELETRARARGARRIVLNARENALSFYRGQDYVIMGQAELLFGIPHWEMQKILVP